jgi:hypothetical protein
MDWLQWLAIAFAGALIVGGAVFLWKWGPNPRPPAPPPNGPPRTGGT